ncbi:hypothetical protein EGW08_002185 [Elysia chlorotica]|uniref:YEATS domain-containing protein 2 n=1 Tax=Elysia chlorotica TaxID=188477 RepID=A0A3S1CDY0_ELYCH|nr:hypothetical protein EGW08_002185 [Elysia chlorotica]
MSAQKRSHETVDPDYTDTGEQQVKRQRVLEQDAKESVSRKIKAIVQNEFKKEISIKETELQNIDKKLNDALLQMDRLRACIVASYYGQKHTASSSQVSAINAPPPSIHPAVKKYLGKAPKGLAATKSDSAPQAVSHTESHERLRPKLNSQDHHANRPAPLTDPQPHTSVAPVPSGATYTAPSSSISSERHSRFKIKKKIIVGNVSKYIPVDSREANDMSSHKWMVYVRGPKTDPDISGFVRRVWFFLHHSYKPNDLVEVSSPPFHLTRRGWGEFPVRVQLHFVDPRNKKLDIIHHLKLDKTFTGLQTLGAETVVEVELNPESLPVPLLGTPSAQASRLEPPPSCSGPAANGPSTNSKNNNLRQSQSDTALGPPDEHSATEEDKSWFMQTVSLFDADALIKNEIVKSEDGGDAETGNHWEPGGAEQEYHMTIAHEQGLSLLRTVKEEPDHEVDVCADDDQNRKVCPPAVTKSSSADVSSASISVSLNESLTSIIKEEAMDTSDSWSTYSDSHSIPSISWSADNLPSVPVSASLSLRTLPASSGSSSVTVEQTKSSLNYQVENVPTPMTRVSGVSGLKQPMKLTVIKDPLKFKPHVEPALSNVVVTRPNVGAVIASPASSSGCVTTVCTATTATVQISTGSVLSSATFLQPSLVSQSPGNAVSTLPVQQIQDLQHGGAISKMVVIKPNSVLPRKVVHKVSYPQTQNTTSPIHLVQTAQTLVQSSQPFVHKTFSGETSYTSLHPPPSPSVSVGGDAQPVVIAAAPTLKPGPSRQVSLLTGLVVGGQPSSPSPHVGPSVSTSLARNHTIRDNKIVITPTSARSINASAGTEANIPVKAGPIHSPQVPHIVVLNKPKADGHSVVIPKPSLVSPVNQVHSQGGRTVIKLVNRNPASQLTSSVPKVVDPHSKPITLVSNVQQLLTHAGNQQVLSAQNSVDAGFSSVTPVGVEVNSLAQPSYSAAQVMLSFPGGATMPLTQDLEASHFPKMSAVGITKYGKGYRSILNQHGSKKTVSYEDRLKGQYEVLRAFKENPELYKKKSKKVVLAASDTIEGEEDVIPQLKVDDFQTMRTLVKAAVLLHPIVQDGVNKITHPYCANSIEEWNSWPIGKQRAAEWHRSCFTLRYLKSCLSGQTELGGERLLSTRQLVDWCRLRAFSPVLPVKPRSKSSASSGEAAAAVTPESFNLPVLRQQAQSYTLLDGLHSLLPVTQAESLKGQQDDGDNEVNVVDEGTSVSNVKPGNHINDAAEETRDTDDWISPSEGALFVHEELRKVSGQMGGVRGVRLQPQELEDGIMACLPAEMIYRVMMEFCSDVLRETLAVCENPLTKLTSQDVHSGLASLPEASFCCNKFLGKHDEQDMEFAVSG